MSKKNGKVIHTNTLKPSTKDTISLADAVEERFIQLLNLWFKSKGEKLVPPTHLDGDMRNWRMMRVRHKHWDFRNTDGELKSTKVIAQWTVDMKNILCGQPEKIIEWGD